MGQAVNLAFLVRDWVDDNAPSGIAAPRRAVIDKSPEPPHTGKPHATSFRGIPDPVQVLEIKHTPPNEGGKG